MKIIIKATGSELETKRATMEIEGFNGTMRGGGRIANNSDIDIRSVGRPLICDDRRVLYVWGVITYADKESFIVFDEDLEWLKKVNPPKGIEIRVYLNGRELNKKISRLKLMRYINS